MSRKLTSYFQYSWWMYLLSALVIIVVWYCAFTVVAKPKDNEKIQITFFDGSLQQEELSAHLNQNKGNLSTQSLKLIQVEKQKVDINTIHYLVTSRVYSTDLLVFDEALLVAKEGETPTINVKSYFLPISDKILQDIFGEGFSQVEYYRLDGKVYGIYLDYALTENTTFFENYTDCSNRYVLFFSHKSPNASVIFDQTNNGQNGAVDVVKYLLEVK